MSGKRIVLRGGSLDGRSYVVASDVVSITAPDRGGKEVYSRTAKRDAAGREIWLASCLMREQEDERNQEST